MDVLISASEINDKVKHLGQEISEKYRHLTEPLILIGILKGSFLFLADLCRAIDLPVEIEFMGVSSYGEATKSSGVVQITQDLTRPIQGRHVLIVEDIVDTGLTAKYLLNNFQTRKPASIAICALLEKPSNNAAKIHVDHLGFSIADEFVVGYGLDYKGVHRNLPFVGVLKT